MTAISVGTPVQIYDSTSDSGTGSTTETVPAGKIWKVHLIESLGSGNSGDTSINGKSANTGGQNFGDEFPLVMPAGSTITYSFDDSDQEILIKGWEYDETDIDNTPILEFYAKGSDSGTTSRTVPAGETWRVIVRASVRDGSGSNGYCNFARSSYSGSNTALLFEETASYTILRGGDTIEWDYGAGNNRRYVIFTGWKI